MLVRTLVAAFLIVTSVWMSTEGAAGPSLIATQQLPKEVRTLTDSTWKAFVSAFPEQGVCLSDVRLTLVPEVTGGAARYVREPAEIEIEIPTSPGRYPESLAHELGHHLEATCDVRAAIAGAFLRAQGFEPGDDWERAERWEDRPTEHFAESVVEMVLGSRLTHSDVIEISPEAARIVATWAQVPGSPG